MCIRDRLIPGPAAPQNIAVAFVAVEFRLASAAEQPELVLAPPANAHAGCLFVPVSYTHLDVYKRQPLKLNQSNSV